MVKLLLDLADDEDKIVEIYKLLNGLKTKQEAIKGMIRHFQVEVKPVNMNEKEYFR